MVKSFKPPSISAIASREADTPFAALMRYIAAPKQSDAGGNTSEAAPEARLETNSTGLTAALRTAINVP